MLDDVLVKEVLQVAKRLDRKNLVNAYEGNISAKRGGQIYITPTGKNKEFLTEKMIAVLDENGDQISGSCKPTSETPMHVHIYTMRADIGGVVHAHPPFMTAYALCNLPIKTKAYPELMGNFTEFPVAAYGRPGTDDIYRDVHELIQKRDVIILANHGALAVGKTVLDAMNKIEAAESIAKTLFISHLLGEPVDLQEEECRFFFSLN